MKPLNNTSNQKRSIRITGALLLCLCCWQHINAINNLHTGSSKKNLSDSGIVKQELVSDSSFLVMDTNNTDAIVIADAIEPKHKKDSVKIIYKYNSPKRAVVYSMILPGLGQAYNKKYWKLPIIYGGATVLYYFYELNNDYYQRFKTAYNQLIDYQTNPAVIEYELDRSLPYKYHVYLADQNIKFFVDNPISDIELQTMTKQALALNRDYYRRNRDYNIIFFFVLYVANIVDAMVDAHMLYYDVSDDLAIKFEPYMQPTYSSFQYKNQIPTCGLNLSIKLK